MLKEVNKRIEKIEQDFVCEIEVLDDETNKHYYVVNIFVKVTKNGDIL